MRRLSKVVNIVPVIAKADTLTLEERDYFKQTVRGVCVSLFTDVWMTCGILTKKRVTFSFLPSHLCKCSLNYV